MSESGIAQCPRRLVSEDLEGVTMTTPSNKLETGRAIRREVLGSDYVDKASATSWPFAKPYADLVSEFCWGAVWSRPGLSRRDRSLLNLGMLAALNLHRELELHIG